MASSSPGSKIGGVSQAIVTRGSSTVSVSDTRCSAVSGGAGTTRRGTSAPRGIVPKYFSTSSLVRATSMSPTMARLALLGT